MNLQADLGGWRNELGGILPHGSLGESLMGRKAVEEKIIDRLPATLELGLLAIVIGLVITLPIKVPSWGGMLSREGRRFMEQAHWLAFQPGLCLTLVVYSLNMFGETVRDLIDPRLRGGG